MWGGSVAYIPLRSRGHGPLLVVALFCSLIAGCEGPGVDDVNSSPRSQVDDDGGAPRQGTRVVFSGIARGVIPLGANVVGPDGLSEVWGEISDDPIPTTSADNFAIVSVILSDACAELNVSNTMATDSVIAVDLMTSSSGANACPSAEALWVTIVASEQSASRVRATLNGDPITG